MKYLLMLSMAVMSGCGLQNQIDQINKTANKNAEDVYNLEKRVAALEAQMAQAKADLLVVNNTMVGLQTNNQGTLGQLADLQAQADLLEAQVTSALVQLATLNGYPNIVAIKDPCSKQGAQDEVFLKLSNGKYLASFSDNVNGTNTRFSLLSDGSFVTTDSTSCKFTVSNNGTVISNEHN